MCDREDRLDQAGDPSRTLEMADVRLHRTDQQGIVGGPSGAVGGAQRGCLDRIPDRGPGAVQFDVLHVARVDAGPSGRRARQVLLGLRARDGQAFRGAVAVHRAAADHRIDPVAVGERGRDRLEHDDGAALAAHEAVRPRVKGEALPVGGQPAETLRADGCLGREVEVNAGGQGQLRLAAAQALAGQVHRHQRRRLGGVHRQARAAQTQDVGQPVGDEAAGQTGEGVPGDGLEAVAVDQPGVVAGDGAHEDTRAGAGQSGRDDPGVLQRLPA